MPYLRTVPYCHPCSKPEVKFLRTSLASRTYSGHILKSLASKVKFVASKLQFLENCSVLGSRTALFFEPMKFRWKTPESSRKICLDFFVPSIGDRLKNVFEDLFFGKHLRLCTWSLVLDSTNTVLGLESVCPWPREGLSSEGLSLTLASDVFFVSLASSLVS